jgi:hypothetical protein
MSYTPNNVCVYTKAFAGALAGLGASGKYITDPVAVDDAYYARMADAFAQQFDTAWGAAVPTTFEEDAIVESSEAVWEGRSPFENTVAFTPGAYAGLVNGIIALVQQGNAQVVAEGVNPNGCSAVGTVNSVAGAAPITSTGGANPVIGIAPATGAAAGSMSAVDKTKLDASASPTFVFRPGGVASGNVYTSWTTMMTAVAAIAGPKWIQVDSSLAAANVPAGTWAVDSVTFLGSVGTILNSLLTFQQGAHISFNILTVDSDLELTSVSTLPVAALPNGAVVNLRGGAIILPSATATFFNAIAAGTVELQMSGFSTLGDGVHSTFTVGAGVTLKATVNDRSTLKINSIAGAGNCTAFVSDDSTPNDTAQTITTFNLGLLSDASRVHYTPAIPGNWSPAPSLVSAALDQLAAVSPIAATAATVTGGVTYTVLTTDVLIKLDSSNNTAPIAVLPAPSVIGEAHKFFWFAWGANQTPPVIQAGGANKLSPFAGMTLSGAAGLVSQTNMTQVGQYTTYTWSGTEWLQTG